MMKKLITLLSIVFCFNAHAQIITTVAGNTTAGYSGDGGQATNAALNSPYAAITDGAGNIYIADSYNNSLRKINTAGIITTVAGNGVRGFSGDGGPATAAQLDTLTGVIVDATGNIYITDTYNYRIRKIDTQGIITTIAGNGTAGYSGDGGQATNAQLNFPFTNVALDLSGNLYIADFNNNCIRKVNTLGIISTIAGNNFIIGGGYSGDGGQATAAALYGTAGLAFDGNGNLYVCDVNNSRVRKIDTSGIITTIAGNGTQGSGGNGGQATNAELTAPFSLAFDGVGNLYISDDGSNLIRMINTSGIISTVVGNGTYGSSGDGGLATNAELAFPMGISFDASGNLYIGDNSNRIRKVSPALNVTVNSAPIICAGATATLTASGAITYTWAPATGLSATTGSAVIASPLITTTYTVMGSSGASLGLAISTITVSLAPISINADSICAGATATLTASGANSYTWNTGAIGTTITATPMVATTYTVTGTDSIGCVNSVTATVNIIPSATASFAMVKDTLAAYTWNVYPTYPYTVVSATWYWGDGTSTIGLFPSHTFASAGMYNICLTTKSACGDSANFCQNDSIYRLGSNSTNGSNNVIQVYVVNPSVTAISTYNIQQAIINIYPNPTQNDFTIETNSSDKQLLNLFDVNGKLVLTQIINGTTTINVGTLTQGIYNVSITSNKSVTNKRLVIVH